ncbi:MULTISPECIES: hypothetical protein [Paenochrobactrum]|uniref:Uncharacterized protein n=2 Tax=Paenochrobactrum TaxID=999488 RepID=A0A841LYM9_9HYPH|nr:hypothetical protein [Paenochrobactrum gallinarii]MBB6262516.1 hypothetical protein [Paenochrobactrum gallinarii]
MKNTFSALRETAEIAFQKTQLHNQIRTRVEKEIDEETRLRAEKTARLKAARLAFQPVETLRKTISKGVKTSFNNETDYTKN